MITPYFINEIILKSDILKIEEILIETFGDRVDRSEIPSINYNNYTSCEKNNISSQDTIQNYIDSFNLIKTNYFIDNNIYVIEVDKNQKCLEFYKISENRFIKKYLFPNDTLKTNKNESGIKSNLILFKL